MAKGKIYETIISLSGNVDPSIKKSIDTIQKRFDGLNKTAVVVGAAAGAAVIGIGKAAKEAASYMADLGDGFNQSMNRLQAQTGATAAEMEDLSSIAMDIYKNNYGEDMDDVSSSIAEIRKTTQLMGEDLQGVTEGALTLRDTFGYDVTKSARAAKAMIDNFGISGEDALSMIAAGAQNGLDYSGELIDSINEYSVQFKKLGFSADDMFNIFQQGAENGSWNLDKISDAVKEFSIRSIDGSKTTLDAFTQLGYNADEVMSIFADGGDNASQAFKVIIKDLMNVDDKVKRDAIGVELFGTQWEDVGQEAIAALADIDGSLYDTNNSLEEIQKIQFNDLDSAFQGIKRQIETSVTPAASTLAGKLTELSPQIQQSMEAAAPYIEDLAEDFAVFLAGGIDTATDAIKWLSENGETLIPILKTIGVLFATFTAVKMISGIYGAVKAFGALKLAQLADKAETLYLMALYGKDAIIRGASTAATVAQTVAQGAWNVVAGIGATVTSALGAAISFLTSPIGLVILAITALIAAGVWLYNNWDLVKQKAAQLGEFLSGVWNNIKTAVSNLIGGIKDMFYNGFSALAGIIKAPINAVIGIINGAINGINSIGFDVPDWVPLVGGKSFSINIPNIPLLAKGGFTNGVSIAGEAGTEAVISFDPSVRSENLSYWAKAGQMLGADSSDYSLATDSGSGQTTVEIGEINFSPKIEITGTADKADIMAAIEAEYPEFTDMLDRYFEERGYFAYGY